MVKKTFIAVILLAIAGLAIGYWLLPQDADMARMEVQDFSYGRPEVHYEQKFAEGDHSLETTQQLVRIHTATGKIDRAISVLEVYVAEHPDDDTALMQLGELYRQAQRYEDYLQILEMRARETNNRAVLQELAELYSFFQQPEKQKATLQRLQELGEGGSQAGDTPTALTSLDETEQRQTLHDLAVFHAIDQNYSQVVVVLNRLMQEDPDSYTQEDATYHVNALLELNRYNEAVTVIRQWQAMPQSEMNDVANLIDMLHYQGDVSYAKQVLNGIPTEEVRNNPNLLHSRLLIMLSEGRNKEAYDELAALYRQDRLPDMLVPDLMYLAASQGNMQQFQDLYSQSGLVRLTEAQLVGIWMIAEQTGQRKVMAAISEHIAKEDLDYPLLKTVMLVDERSPARHGALDARLNEDLSDEDLLRLAEVTARAGDHKYARQFLAKLDVVNLNSSALEEVETIYLAMGDVSSAQAYTKKLRDAGRIDAKSTVGLRTAAASGDATRLRNWRSQSGDAGSTTLFNDLFYQAADHGHLQLALEISNWQKDSSAKLQARRSVADIYTRLGRYEAALNLHQQEPVKTEQDVRDRVFLLAKLAPRSQSHRLQLQELARQWFKPSSSRKLKEDLVFALIDSGDDTLAIPYMRQMADSYGGEWLLSYADMLEKHGEMEQAMSYRLKAAEDPKFSAETKLNLAYALSDGGYSAEAQKLLLALTEQPDTRVAATEQLVYLWGVRPSDTQLNWLIDRWATAQTAEEQEAYARLLSGRIPSNQIVGTVQAYPALRRIPNINQDYLQELAAQHQLDGEINQAAAYASRTQDVRPLVALGRLARDNGALEQSRNAFSAAYAVDETYVPGLVGATVTADAQADYEGVDGYFERYLARRNEANPVMTRELHEAYYAYGQSLRRKQMMAEARPYYEQSLQLVRQQKLQDAHSLSIAAQSAYWSGRPQYGERVFDYAFKRYPSDKVLRADRASMLIEQKRYDEAEALLAQIPQIDARMPNQLDVPLITAADTGSQQMPELLDNGRQVLIYTAPESKAERFWLTPVQENLAVNYATEGYDTVLVVSQDTHRFTVGESYNGWVVNTAPAPSDDFRSLPAQLKLTQELLQARIELETGEVHQATERLAALEDTYAEDAQYQGFAANATFYANNWPAAKEHIAKAQELSPRNKDVATLKRNIDRQHADRVRADVTHVQRGGNTELITALSGQAKVAENWHAGAAVRNHELDLDPRLQPDGSIQGEDSSRQTWELYGVYSNGGNDYWKFLLFGNNDTAGVGADYNFSNRLGVTTLSGRLNEPYFQFVEAIMDNAVRDRIAINHVIKPRTDWEASLGASYNNYSIETADDVMTTFGINGSLTHAIQQQGPYIGLGYGLDAEYEIDSEQQVTSTGLIYRRMPLRSREIHFGSVTVAEEWGDNTYGSVLAGYGWDRLGGHGPAVEGRINHEFYDDWDVGASAFYGLDSTSTTNDDLHILNAYIQHRF